VGGVKSSGDRRRLKDNGGWVNDLGRVSLNQLGLLGATPPAAVLQKKLLSFEVEIYAVLHTFSKKSKPRTRKRREA